MQKRAKYRIDLSCLPKRKRPKKNNPPMKEATHQHEIKCIVFLLLQRQRIPVADRDRFIRAAFGVPEISDLQNKVERIGFGGEFNILLQPFRNSFFFN
jgi:hypothetical protein